MRKLAIVLVAMAIIVLAIIVGARISADAMAVVVGVVCGIGASVPTSLLMLFVLNRRTEPMQEPQMLNGIGAGAAFTAGYIAGRREALDAPMIVDVPARVEQRR